MQKRIIKTIISISIFFICIVCVNHIAFATVDSFNEGISTVKANIENGKLESAVGNTMGIGINLIRVIGAGVAVIMLVYIAIKYMMAAPAEKADFKKSASIYVLGAVLVFASTNILSIIMDFVKKNM